MRVRERSFLGAARKILTLPALAIIHSSARIILAKSAKAAVEAGEVTGFKDGGMRSHDGL